MIGKKVGYLKDIIKSKSELNYIVLKGLFEEIRLGATVSDLQDDFNIKIPAKTNTLMIHSLSDNRLSLKFGNRQKTNSDVDFMNTELLLVIHYMEEGFPVYNSEY